MRGRGYVENAAHGHQQGAGEHEVKGLSREQNLVQVLRRSVCTLFTQPLRRAFLTRRQLVSNVPRHGLRVRDRQKAVLLVRHLQSFRRRLSENKSRGQVSNDINTRYRQMMPIVCLFSLEIMKGKL